MPFRKGHPLLYQWYGKQILIKNGPHRYFRLRLRRIDNLRQNPKSKCPNMITSIWETCPHTIRTRSFEVVYHFTRQAVAELFKAGCQLVILACNTASAKALRTIQQRDLPAWGCPTPGAWRHPPDRRDDGTPSAKPNISAFWGTNGTISSGSYTLEIRRCSPL